LYLPKEAAKLFHASRYLDILSASAKRISRY
jgi:hypothetical protein